MAAILCAKLLPAATIHVLELPYCILTLILAFDIAASPYMGLQLLWEITSFPRPEVGRWPSDMSRRSAQPNDT